MKIFILAILVLSVSHAFAQGNYREEFEDGIRVEFLQKIKAILTHKHYSDTGRSPKSEKELLESCKLLPQSELEDELVSEQKIMNLGRSQGELAKGFGFNSMSEYRNELIQMKSNLLSDPQPPVIGYCDFQSNYNKYCKWSNDKCTEVSDVYRKELQKIIDDKTAFSGGVMKLCQLYVEGQARAHKEALPVIEACKK